MTSCATAHSEISRHVPLPHMAQLQPMPIRQTLLVFLTRSSGAMSASSVPLVLVTPSLAEEGRRNDEDDVTLKWANDGDAILYWHPTSLCIAIACA